MKTTPITSDFPLRPIGDGETQVQVFRSAAEQSAAEEGSHAQTPRSRRPGRSALPPLQRRLYEAEGRPVRFGRYQVIRCVGSGGMGVVYEAVHVEQGQRVALKTLRWRTASGLSRFKNEFRSLCGVAHPNLVALYELGAEDGEWFFTMELVDGQSFLEHVHDHGEGALGTWEYLGETLDGDLPAIGDAALLEESAVRSRGRGFHEGRLRAALRQLASAVAALHELGKLHRDLNPGNVLVTREGRVVVIDFGLVSDRVRRPGAPYDGASGTPAYMSPEQAAGKPATSASDWYGFGVMLFEALTGQLPFTGSTLRMLTNKRHLDAPPPSALVPGVPRDLDQLCVALLQRAPEDRPDASAVLLGLGAPPRRTRPPPPGREPLFAGRRAELAALAAAQRAAAPGRPVAAVVYGPAGIGKTSLCARFLDELAMRGEVVILSGACREREAIPHRLLDAVIDALAAHLAALPEAEARALLPDEGRELASVFPVLEGLGPLTEAPPGSDPAAIDEAAFACLRGALARLAAAQPLVLAIDDAHLGDGRDARRLADLVAATGLFVLLAHASEDLGASPVLAELERAVGEVRHVALGPLSADEARDLAERALPADLPPALDRRAAAGVIAAASEGSPLTVEELALGFAEAGRPVSLDEAIVARFAGLPERALHLVEIVAAAPPPIDRGLLFAAARAGPGGDAALASLTASRLLRATGLCAGDRVRVHDERVRAVVAARTPPAVARQIHLALGLSLAARPGADPAVTAACFERAGALALAAEHLTVAADRAAAGGDPERAAELWGRALAGTPQGTPAARALAVRRAEALAGAGRGVAAAAAYLDGLVGASPAEALHLRGRAAEQLLVAGHLDEGLAALRPVLEAHGVPWPATPRRALWTLGARVVELRLRGTALPEPRAADPRSRARVEALWSAGKGLAMIDPVRSALFVVEALLGALACGDTERAAPALALLGALSVYPGGAAEEARGLELIEEAARFARRSDDPHLLGFSWWCSGLARLCAGRFREALARVDEGLGLLEERRDDLAWERAAHRAVSLRALFELGALAERARRAEAWREDARRRDDRAGEVEAALAVSFSVLARGDVAGARRLVEEAMDASRRGGLAAAPQAALRLELAILLYEGDAARARARLLAAWPAMHAAQLLRIQIVRIEALHLRGLTALALGGPALRRFVELDAASLERERRPHALAAAALLRAGVAAGRGKTAVAASLLDAAARGYASAEMRVHAAAARRVRGALLGGPEGGALVAEADALLAAEGVRDGARWAAMYTGIDASRRPSG